MSFSPKKVLVLVADRTEPIEAVIMVNVLRRSGADVTVASVADRVRVDACYGIKIMADALLSDYASANYNLVALLVGFRGRRLKARFRVSGDEDLEASVEEEPIDEICSDPAIGEL